MAEQWYAVFDFATGAAVSFGTSVGAVLPANLVVKQIDHQPGAGEHWDPVLKDVVPDA